MAVKLKTSDSAEERMEAVKTMGHLAWTGGSDGAQFCGEHYLKTLVTILQSPREPQCVRIEIVKALGEICRMHVNNQALARECGLIQVLLDLLLHINQEMRMWATHTLFFLLCGNTENQIETLAVPTPKVQMMFVRVISDDWSDWQHNDAKECLKMLGLGSFPETAQ
eukprot:m.64231 g.64231  ORF g.64231 m.64231 type:complete len:167 (+) comp35229_c0_seq1:3299-3799(+)